MEIFKLGVNDDKIYNINKEEYENATKKSREKYYIFNENTKNYKYYAVCPYCNNPIEIINLINDNSKPYGRHYAKSISIAQYNQTAYNLCPLSSKNKIDLNNESRRRNLTKIEKDIYNRLKDHFDQAIYILNEKLEIRITNKVAEELLEKYVLSKGYLYDGSTLYNIPYMLLYLHSDVNLFGQPILENSELYKAIKEKFPEVIFSDYQGNNSDKKKVYKLLNIKQGYYIKINYSFRNHKFVDNKIETLVFSVDLEIPKTQVIKNVYEKTIELDPFFFQRLIEKSKKNLKNRSKELLEIAEKLMPPLK